MDGAVNEKVNLLYFRRNEGIQVEGNVWAVVSDTSVLLTVMGSPS